MAEEDLKIEQENEETHYYDNMKKNFQNINIKESSRKSAFLSMFLLTIFFASVKVFVSI